MRHNPPLHGVRVIGSNMISVMHGDAEVLYSYETPVAVKVYGGIYGVYVTTKQWSRTTSKHIGTWLRTFGYSGTRDLGVGHVSQSEIERIASAGGDRAGAPHLPGAPNPHLISHRGARMRRPNPPDDGEHHPDDPYPDPGKFEGETWLTVQVYESSNEGGADEEIGSVDEIGWYALFTNFEASDGSKRHGILSEDSNGFVSFAESDTAEEAQAEFSQIVDEYNRFDEEQEQD